MIALYNNRKGIISYIPVDMTITLIESVVDYIVGRDIVNYFSDNEKNRIARFSSIFDRKMDLCNMKSVRMNCTNEVIMFDGVKDIDFNIEFPNTHTVFFKNCDVNSVYYNIEISKMPELKTVYINSKFDYEQEYLEIYQEKKMFDNELKGYDIVEPTFIYV